MTPLRSERNFTPSSTALESESDRTAGVAVLCQMVQGHVVDPDAAVVKDHEKLAAIAAPVVSLTPLAPPLTVAVYVEEPARAAVGVSVAVSVPAL
jgi:hypothetical protein